LRAASSARHTSSASAPIVWVSCFEERQERDHGREAVLGRERVSRAPRGSGEGPERLERREHVVWGVCRPHHLRSFAVLICVCTLRVLAGARARAGPT
jgi:hypothetical protein